MNTSEMTPQERHAASLAARDVISADWTSGDFLELAEMLNAAIAKAVRVTRESKADGA